MVGPLADVSRLGYNNPRAVILIYQRVQIPPLTVEKKLLTYNSKRGRSFPRETKTNSIQK